MKGLILAAAVSLFAANVALAQAPAATPAPAPAAAPAAAPATPAKAKKAPSAKQVAQQNRMKECNKEAKTQKLKGDKRKQFMSECLKADKPAAATEPAAQPAAK